MSTKKATSTEIAVMVTTEHRGVFFGYADRSKIDGDVIDLKRARNCVYWTADLRGFLGLATAGPNRSCRIGPAVASLQLRQITSVAEVSDEAAQKWESAPWNG